MLQLTAEVERFVRFQQVARLATVDARGRPHAVPIVYVYERTVSWGAAERSVARRH